jgi:tetratricopeptide (TPR) repeat protein
MKRALALLIATLLVHGCTLSPLPRLTSVGSAEQALEEAQVLAEEGRWSQALDLLEAARREYPDDAAVAAEEQRVREHWSRLKARLEDQLLLIHAGGMNDEISVLEPLVTAEPYQLSRAWSLDYKKQALARARDDLLECAEREIDYHLSLAAKCLDLSETVETDPRSLALRQEIERREAEQEAIEAAREAERAAREAATSAKRQARSVRKKNVQLNRQVEHAEQLVAEGRYAEASVEIDKVLAKEPDNTRALGLRSGLDQIIDRQRRVLGELAGRLYTDGELDAAIQVWEALLSISPDHAETLERLDRAKRVRDKLNQFREQQQPESAGEGDATGVAPN